MLGKIPLQSTQFLAWLVLEMLFMFYECKSCAVQIQMSMSVYMWNLFFQVLHFYPEKILCAPYNISLHHKQVTKAVNVFQYCFTLMSQETTTVVFGTSCLGLLWCLKFQQHSNHSCVQNNQTNRIRLISVQNLTGSQYVLHQKKKKNLFHYWTHFTCTAPNTYVLINMYSRVRTIN